MRVVVTRPEMSGMKTAALLRERGHESVLLPLTKPIHNIEAVADALTTRPALIAVTSAEAIRAIEASGVDIANIRDAALFAVGSATAKAARGIGFDNVRIGDGDGRALAELIIGTVVGDDATRLPLVYLAGHPREAAFEEAVREARIDLQTVEAYEMKPVEWKRTEIESRLSPPPGAALLYSRETARAFFSLIGDMHLSSALDNTKFICISEKVLSVVPEAFRPAAHASATPRESAMFDLIDQIAGT